MGVTKTVSTLDGGLTPICSCCGTVSYTHLTLPTSDLV